MTTNPPTLQVAMLLYPGLTLIDLVGPESVLSMHSRVHLVWKTREPVESDGGVRIVPNATFADCPRDLDVLFVPGGFGTAAMMANEEVLAFLRDRGHTARFVTSVCSGSLILGAAGLLDGYRASAHWSVLELLEGFGAKPTKARVVTDRNRITGGGATAGLDFGLTLLATLRDTSTAKLTQLLMEYDPAPPFDAGSPESAGPQVTAQARAIIGPFVESARSVMATV